MDWENFWTNVVNTGLKLVISAVILIVGFKIIDFLFKKIEGKNAKSGKVDKTLAHTLIYVAKVACKCLIVVALVGYLGIDTSGIAAVIASLGVCVGLAVNGALGNIAGGVLILITRPFKVDDFIEIDGYQGTVEDIRLCHTRICTLDNKVVYVPNGTASNANVVNFSEKEFRRIDLEFEISEEESFEDAKQILMDIVKRHPLVIHNDPALENVIRVCGATDNGVVICCRAWVRNADYWGVFFDLREEAKKMFDEAQIEFPYEQMDVRVIDKRDREAR